MKIEYIKPSVGIVLLKSDLMVLENSGVASNPRAKESEFEEEEAPVYQNNSIWADEEKED